MTCADLKMCAIPLLIAFISTALLRCSVGDGVLVVVMDTPVESCNSPSSNDDVSEDLQTRLKSLTEIVNETFSQDFHITLVLSTCDNTDVTVYKLLDVIRHHDVIGILTMARDPTASVILKVTKYMNIPVVEMLSDDVINRPQTRANHLVLPHHTYAVLQSTLAALKILNWTAGAVTSTGSVSASRGVIGLFRKMSFEEKFCVLPSTFDVTTPLVVFAEEDSHEAQLNAERNTGPILYVNLFPKKRSNYTGDNSSSNSLYLDITDIRYQQMVDNLPRNCENASEANSCDLVSVFQNISDKEQPSFLMFIMGLSLTMSSQCPLLNTSSCSSMDTGVSKCFLLNYLCPENHDPMGLVEFFASRRSRRVQVHTRTEQEELYEELSVGTENLFLTKHLPVSSRNKDCGHFCSFCPDCLTTETSRTRSLVSGEGDVYVAGYFPTYRSSETDDFAHYQYYQPSGPNLSQQFLNSFKVPQNRNNEPHFLRIQGIVADFSDSENSTDRFRNDIAHCREILSDDLDYINNRTVKVSIQPSQIIAYIDTTSRLKSAAEGRLVVSVDHSGFSSGEDLKLAFVQNALKALRHVKWTVVNVIASEGEPFVTLLQHFRDDSTAGDFCYVNVIASRSALTPDDLGFLVRSMQQTTVYLLLTNAADTTSVLRYLRESPTALTGNVSLVFTPWNQYLIDHDDISPFVAEYVILRPASVAKPNDTQREEGLESAHNLTSGCVDIARRGEIAMMAVVKKATRSLMSAWKQTAPDAMRDPDVTDVSLDVIYGKGDKQIHIATVDEKLEIKNNHTVQSRDTCRGWCPICYACRNKRVPNRTSLYTHGDLVLTGLFPIRSSGTAPFQCGQVNLDLPKFQTISAFMYALRSAKARYPGLLPGIEVGGLILDTCSDTNTAVKMFMDFETCSSTFGNPDLSYGAPTVMDELMDLQSKFPNPIQNIGYIVDAGNVNEDIMKTVMASKGDKPFLFVNGEPRRDSQRRRDTVQAARAIVELLASLKEKRLIIVYEDTSPYQSAALRMLTVFREDGLCTATLLGFNTSEPWRLELILASHAGLPAVLISSKITARTLFKGLVQNVSFWIIPMISDESWAPHGESIYPLGSIIIDWKSKFNEDFQLFLGDDAFDLNTKPLWYRDLWRMLYSCFFLDDTIRDPMWNRECLQHSFPSDIANIYSSDVYNIIITVDSILHALHGQYVKSCPEARGICPKFAEDIVSRRISLADNVTFLYQGKQLYYVNKEEIVSTLSVFNTQKSGITEVGEYLKGVLSLNKTKLELTPSYLPSSCGSSCDCINFTEDNRSTMSDPDAALYTTSQGEIIYEIWTITVFSVAASGALVSFLFSIYVMYKICIGALGRQYIGLGLTLLFALILLYLSVLPYMITPSETVCSLRYFWPGVAYAFCFAVIFVKLMTLQNYKLIGLGGEVSGINQLASVFFVTIVQVASSVQWWIYNTPSIHSRTYQSEIMKFACKFNKTEFSLYLVYVMFLMLLCSIYSIGVRNEKKNMGEAKLLMTSSWACSAIWVAWILGLFLVDRKWSDAIVCVGTVTCATVVLLIVFLPKLRMVSHLKYDLSQKNHARNGCSVDKDFLYERPHSLPGTLTSTFSSGKMNYPKSLANFDADVTS